MESVAFENRWWTAFAAFQFNDHETGGGELIRRFALRFEGRKRVHDAGEIISGIVAKRLVEHLERSGFVVMKNRLSSARRSLVVVTRVDAALAPIAPGGTPAGAGRRRGPFYPRPWRRYLQGGSPASVTRSLSRSRRMSSFRGLPRARAHLIWNCLDFGWRSRHLQKAVRWRGPAVMGKAQPSPAPRVVQGLPPRLNHDLAAVLLACAMAVLLACAMAVLLACAMAVLLACAMAVLLACAMAVLLPCAMSESRSA